MDATDAHLSVRVAETPEDLRAVQRLRYDVFVDELGGSGALVDHVERLEQDMSISMQPICCSPTIGIERTWLEPTG